MQINRKIIYISSLTLLTVFIVSISAVLIFHKTNRPSKIHAEVMKSIKISPTLNPAMIHNMLNGEILSQTQFNNLLIRRPLAVMIPNSPDARPQSGVNEADVVYEALTEGPVTRFMAIFWSNQSQFKLMPVRSIRAYFLRWLLEYNDIVVMHTGYAATDNPATNALAILKDYNVKTLIWDYPWAYDDKCKKTTPVWDCAFTDSITLWNTAQSHGWTGAKWNGISEDKQWKFKNSPDLIASETANTINIPFLYTNDYSQTYWTYDTANNRYLRFDYNHRPQIDLNNNTQINTKTLVVEQVPFVQTHDIKDRSEQAVIGTGKTYVFEDGKVIQGTWRKNDIKAKTRFFDQNGLEIAFNRGRIWISVVPDTQTITFN